MGRRARIYRGRAPVEKNGKWGFIDTAGNVVVPLEYDTYEHFHCGLAPVEQNEKSGYADLNGNLVIPIQYDSTAYFYQNRAWVKRDGQYLMIDTTGAQVGANVWQNVFSDFMCSDLCRIFLDGKWGYVNLNNETVLNPVYEKATRFENGIAAVRQDGEWFLIDATGARIQG